jgi:hypothetical protein
MMPALLSGQPRIARLRVRTARSDSLQVSLRAGALLDRLDLSPPGLPPSSVLLIRALRDPLPGRVSFERVEAAPAHWQQAVAGSLARLAREAARPARDPAPTGAAAVLFADEAEMIACLVQDWLAGRVADCWWWKTVLGSLNPRQWLRTHVLVRGELMVPVMARLAAARDAVKWILRLEDGEAAAAVAAIERSHAVSVRVREENSLRRGELRDIKPDSRAGAGSAAFKRLSEAVPEVRIATLRPAQRALAAVALALARAPSWARTPQLALALQELERVDALTAAPHVPSIPEVSRPGVAKSLPKQPAAVAGAPRTDETPPALEQGPSQGHNGEPSPHPQIPMRPRTDAVSVRTSSAMAIPGTARMNELPEILPSEVGQSAPVAEKQPESAPLAEYAARVYTKFGGIFYLLNAALALKLYADFTSPRSANLRVSPWDWLALVGRAWFGREFVRDPVWKQLAALSGRQGRRLRRPRWLERQLETLLARLALALGEDRPPGIPALVCRYRAGIAVTASRVDVHLFLADLPLALRIAGLDRDPGWIPAAGRSVAFHFE